MISLRVESEKVELTEVGSGIMINIRFVGVRVWGDVGGKIQHCS
jgi:hypothetical protein